MVSFILSSTCLIALISTTLGAGKNWALLVAGSKGWTNYRHQADMCHAYHVMKKAGVPADNIVTMLFDDVAYNRNNPNPGQLINHPDGLNVYAGVVKDYTNNDLSVKNLLNVLTGKIKEMKGIGSGRVIESGPEDTVFVYIVDHGGPGTISINDDKLYADQLNDALIEMKVTKKFKKMVVYVEACESGSMFDSLTEGNSNVFVMTAAAPNEPSFVSYYDDNLQTYIGDKFSTTWLDQMEELINSQSLDLSLFDIYKSVRSDVTSSHVMIYGDFHRGFDHISTYTGQRRPAISEEIVNLSSTTAAKTTSAEKVSSRDVELTILQKKLNHATTAEQKMKLTSEIRAIQDGRELIDEAVEDVMQDLAAGNDKLFDDLAYVKPRITSSIFPCYRAIMRMFASLCVDSNTHPYATSHFGKFINICHQNIKLSKVRASFKKVCDADLHESLTVGIY